MKVVYLGILLTLGISFLYFVAWTTVSNRVDRATTEKELQEACSGLSVQSAPTRCLRGIN